MIDHWVGKFGGLFGGNIIDLDSQNRSRKKRVESRDWEVVRFDGEQLCWSEMAWPHEDF